MTRATGLIAHVELALDRSSHPPKPPLPLSCCSGYFLSPRRDTNVPFHPGHHRAVQHFIRTHFGTAPLTVFHWRSEHVDESMLVPCAHDLAGVVSQFDWPATPSGYRGLLMSDMPAPNNNHIMVSDCG